MGVENDLRKETGKWTKKIQEEMEKISGDKEFIKNINAYISDSGYFFEKNDFIRAFEAVIWAWAYLTIGKEIGAVKVQ